MTSIHLLDYVKSDGEFKENLLGRSNLQGKERVLCFDAAGGTLLWKYEYDCPYKISYPAGPRCTPTVHAGKVYALGAMGNLFCLDAAKGTVLWSKDFPKDYGAARRT
ncbi:MAG: PQQ-binding-like beta-propeller repeat protein [Gemmataceae bacterium]|nr:PQQ-binding-like beta-propeller repeat protein [Gemmataceae bacterium]